MPDAQADPRFSPRRLDASEQIALELRRYIERQELEPGDRVGTEHELAAEFGVSRPTLREALRLLAGSHLLRVERGRSGGIFVAGTPTQGLGRALSASIATLVAADSVGLRQLFEVRALLEGGVAALAAERADESALATLSASVDEVARSRAGTARFGRAAVRFHRVLAEAAGNDLLVAFTGWILDVLLPQMGAELAPRIDGPTLASQYRAVLDEIVARRPEAAERAMRAHIAAVAALFASAPPKGKDQII
jgi:GntR family transcriptional regulator, transcriptional repressor for pyruvate dehydrogenase complex